MCCYLFWVESASAKGALKGLNKVGYSMCSSILLPPLKREKEFVSPGDRPARGGADGVHLITLLSFQRLYVVHHVMIAVI